MQTPRNLALRLHPAALFVSFCSILGAFDPCFGAEHRARFLRDLPAAKIPASNPIQIEKWQAYVAAHPKRMQSCAESIGRHIEHVDHAAFEGALQLAIQTFLRTNEVSIKDGRFIIGIDDPGHSGEWVTALAARLLRDSHELQETLLIYPDQQLGSSSGPSEKKPVQEVLVFDDAIYTGNRLGANLLALEDKWSDYEIHFHVVVAASTKYGKDSLEGLKSPDGTFSDNTVISVYSGRTLQTVEEIDDNEFPDVLYESYTIFEGTTLTYFDHKLPDSMSFIAPQFPSLEDGKSCLEGLVVNSAGRCRRRVPFVDKPTKVYPLYRP